MTTEATTTPQAPAAQPSPAVVVPPQASPVPAATPAAPATPTPAPAADKAPATATETPAFGAAVDYLETGNTNLDAALKWAGSMGLNVETMPEMQQAMAGNFAPLKALLASKQIPGSDAYVALAEAGYREYQAGKEAATQTVQQMVVEIAGDEGTWGQVMDWARENAEPNEKEQINAALATPGFVAEAVAARLVHNFQAQSGVTIPQRAEPVKDTASALPPAAGNGPLSPQEYGQAVMDLRRSMKGKPVDGTPEYAALQRRRAAYRG